jgi:carbonic anhydrase
MLMDRRRMLKAMAGLALCPVCAKNGFAAEGAHWSYEGATGPDKWGEIDAASRVCSIGSEQSPIDIRETIGALLPPINLSWRTRPSTIVNNGHTIQLNVAEGSTLSLGAKRYTLVQFHFHRPSEHLIGGKNFPMEVHFVHRHETGALAVLGVLMSAGKANPVFNTIVKTMPMHEGEPVAADPKIDPAKLLPRERAYYRYEGSLTTPPCSETVDWLVLTTPLTVAQGDIDAFAKLYPMNARPVQKPNRRFVLRAGG